MATSGSIDFTVTRDTIITEALEQLGVLNAGDLPTAEDITTCARSLNMMIKTWQANDIEITTVSRRYLFVQTEKSEYRIDGSSTRFTDKYTRTQIDGAVSSGATLFDVDDASLASVGDKIGIYQSDGTMHWTSINAIAGNTLGISAAFAADVDDDALVYFYTNTSPRFIEVVEAFVRNYCQNDRPIYKLSRKDWAELTSKEYDGQITQIHYDPQVNNTAQNREATLFVWPRASDPRDILVMWVKRTVEDFDAADDNPDFPQEFYLPLALNLAKVIASKYGVPTRDKNYQNVLNQADFWYQTVKDYWSRPKDNLWSQPSMEGYGW